MSSDEDYEMHFVEYLIFVKSFAVKFKLIMGGESVGYIEGKTWYN